MQSGQFPTEIQNRAFRASTIEEKKYMRTILLIILVLLVLGSLPAWPYSAGWGYYPSGGLGLVLLIVLVLVVMDRI